jgi:hypothetical protein
VADALLAAVAGALAPEASALIQNKPYTLSPEQIAQFQAVVDAAAATATDNAVDVTINELAPTGLEPLVFQHVLPATVDVNGTALVQPTHCDEPWLIQLNGPAGTEPVVLNLDPAAWQNKPFTLSADQLSQLGLPTNDAATSTASAPTTDEGRSVASAPTSSADTIQFQLSTADVLLAPADAAGKHVVHVIGDSNDTLNLTDLLSPDATTAQWLATGTVQQGDTTFNTYTYSADTSLQVMVDQHLQNVTLS